MGGGANDDDIPVCRETKKKLFFFSVLYRSDTKTPSEARFFLFKESTFPHQAIFLGSPYL